MKRINRIEQEKQARIEYITETAAFLFSEKGYHSVTMEDIAHEVGLAKGTLYLYFKNKEDLFFSILKEKTQLLLTRIRFDINTDIPYIEQLNDFVRTYLNFFEDHRAFFKIIQSEEGRVDIKDKDNLHRHLLKSFNDYFQILVDFIKEGQDKGELRKQNPLVAAKVLRGILHSFTSYWVIMGSEDSLIQEAPYIVKYFLNGAGNAKKKKLS